MPQSPILILMDVPYYSLSVIYAQTFFWPLRSQDAEEKTLAWISKFTAKFDEASVWWILQRIIQTPQGLSKFGSLFGSLFLYKSAVPFWGDRTRDPKN